MDMYLIYQLLVLQPELCRVAQRGCEHFLAGCKDRDFHLQLLTSSSGRMTRLGSGTGQVSVYMGLVLFSQMTHSHFFALHSCSVQF